MMPKKKSSWILGIPFFVLIHVAHCIPIDNSMVGDPAINCLPDSLSIDFKTAKAFGGRVFVKGFSQDSNCNLIGAGKSSFDFSIGFDNCGLRRTRELNGVSISTTVVVSFHPIFITKVDRAYRVNCFYLEAKKTLYQQLDVSELTTQVVSKQTTMPVCRYDILSNGPTGKPVRYARIGDHVYHRWSCESESPGVYCMKVHSCSVSDGQGGEPVLVLNEEGCEIDRFVLQNLDYTGDLTAGQGAHVFKFADKPSLHFNCQIELSLKDPKTGCQYLQPQCFPNGDTSDINNPSSRSGSNSGYFGQSGTNSGYSSQTGSNSGYSGQTGSTSGYPGESGYSSQSGSSSGYSSQAGTNSGYSSQVGSSSVYSSRSGTSTGYSSQSGSNSGYSGQSGSNYGYSTSTLSNIPGYGDSDVSGAPYSSGDPYSGVEDTTINPYETNPDEDSGYGGEEAQGAEYAQRVLPGASFRVVPEATTGNYGEFQSGYTTKSVNGYGQTEVAPSSRTAENQYEDSKSTPVPVGYDAPIPGNSAALSNNDFYQDETEAASKVAIKRHAVEKRKVADFDLPEQSLVVIEIDDDPSCKLFSHHFNS